MSYEKKSQWAKHIDFILIDLICSQVALMLADMMRNGMSHPFRNESYGRLAVMVGLIFICMVFFMEPYSGILRRGFLLELKSVILFNVTIIIGLIVYLFLVHSSAEYSRVVFFCFFMLSICLMYTAHIFWKRWIRRRTNLETKSNRLVLVTTPKYVHKCVDRLLCNLFGAEKLIGIILLEDNDGEDGATVHTKQCVDHIEGIPVVGHEELLIEYCRKNVVDDVLFYSCPEQTRSYSEQLYNMGIRIHVNLVDVEENYLKYHVDTINGIMALSTSINQTTAWQKAIKRLMDIIGGLIGCVLTGVIAIFVAPIIKIQAPGPVLFSQMRVGRNGREFKIYKFRSMYVDAEERKKELMEKNKMKGFMFKMDNDPRIFPFGRLLRKTSLDEFPQFINVLKGEMSLVGTRPPTLDEYVQYEPHHKSRLAMKPGITGLWQVSGRNDITDFEEVVRLDNEYIRNWSLLLDVKILGKTVMVVFGKDGAL